MHQYAELIALCRQAGEAILEVYHRGDTEVWTKDDDSPLTEADLAANTLLLEGLARISGLPVVSEEMPVAGREERSSWVSAWLLDPLDGTKEFIGRTGEFTINLALIENHQPVFGIIYVPLSGEAFYGGPQMGAFVQDAQGQVRPLQASNMLNRLKENLPVRLLASRRHAEPTVDKLCQRLHAGLADVQRTDAGSALKFTLMCSKQGDIYPRYSNVSEWDIAAGHALLRAVGGEVYDHQFETMTYLNKPSVLVPGFFAVADQKFDWRALLPG
ncbi:MAG: 3'(2'),5'-bisphosphate nucleotidase CysQ [Oceanospirillaceae bacterium]|nr:3'(2'),5'-bisphosphate nucleotidase CysQ [Oceanospirillaceae bacterium]MCP5350401.1 3'(2'),5'-bisphosphate nucleotidase CysQ [Oceanospirillaceae bacterium]